MKKGKITVVITIALACFALTTVMFMQFKIVNETDITSIETMREEELRTEFATWKQKYKEAEEQYQEKTEKLNEYKKMQETTEESSKVIEKELQQTDLYLGKTEVEGEGIEIKINETNDEDVGQISEEELLVIVDYLKLAGAEAISINEERIINTSDIVSISNTIINVNGQRILPPYIIKAIGDSTTLQSTLLGKGGYVETLRNAGYNIEMTPSNKIVIHKYSKDIGYKYIQ